MWRSLALVEDVNQFVGGDEGVVVLDQPADAPGEQPLIRIMKVNGRHDSAAERLFLILAHTARRDHSQGKQFANDVSKNRSDGRHYRGLSAQVDTIHKKSRQFEVWAL